MAQTATSGAVQLVRAEPQHVPELGRICYEAFKDLHDRHRVHLDFASVSMARHAIGLLVSREDSMASPHCTTASSPGRTFSHSPTPLPVWVLSRWTAPARD